MIFYSPLLLYKPDNQTHEHKSSFNNEVLLIYVHVGITQRSFGISYHKVLLANRK